MNMVGVDFSVRLNQASKICINSLELGCSSKCKYRSFFVSPTLARSANWSACWLCLASVWFAVWCPQFWRVGSSQTTLLRDESSVVRFSSLCPWGWSPRGSCCSINWPDTAVMDLLRRHGLQRTSSSLRMHLSNAVPALQWGVITQIDRLLWDSESWVRPGHAMLHGTSLVVVSEILASASASVSCSMRRFRPHTQKTTLNTYIWVVGGGFWEVYLGLGDRTCIHPEIRAVTN